MLIRITCPNPQCQKQLRIDAKHAGKKISCTSCKQHIRLPSAAELKIDLKEPLPASVPEAGVSVAEAAEEIIDFDAMATEAVVAEKTAQVDARKTDMVEFTCPQCDEPIKISAENAGKRAPCPSCRRIIAVPKLDSGKPLDWREKQAQGPTLAKKEEVKLEGAWGNEQVARVSLEALEEAKAIPKIKRKLTTRDYLRIGTSVVVVLAVIGVSWWGWKRLRSSSLEGNTIAAVQSAIADTKLPPDMNAVLRRGLGEWKLQTGVSNDVKKDGLAELQKAITSSGDPLWTWVLANDAAQVVGPMVSLDTNPTGVVDLHFLRMLITSVRQGEPREDVIRTLCRSVIRNSKGEKLEAARTLLTTVIKQSIQPVNTTIPPAPDAKDKSPVSIQDYSEQLSALGILAQELMANDGKDSALQLVGKTSDRGERVVYKKGMQIPKPFVAVMAALSQQDYEVNKDMETDFELGKMVGYYLANQDAKGDEIFRKRKEAGFDQGNLLSFLNIAEQAIDAGRIPEALLRLTEAMKIAQLYSQDRNEAWKLRVYAHVRLCELTARTGEIALAEERIVKLKLDEIPVAALVARTLVARNRPVQVTEGESLVAGLPANSSGQALAAFTLAKKQAELAGVPEPKLVGVVPEGPVRSLATLGGLLSVKLSQKK